MAISTCQKRPSLRQKAGLAFLSTLLLLSFLALHLQGVAAQGSTNDDFYKLMEVSPQAQLSEIKKAYRRLSKKYHPDKNPGDEEAADHYKKINRAYEVLSNDELREVYDQGGEDGLQRFESGQGKMQKGPNARADIHVTLEELYLGGKRTLNINRNIYCTQCRGSGAKDGKLKTCPKCQGRGVSMQTINMMGMQMQMQQTCPTCGGKGQTMAAKCPHCKGRRVVNDNKKVTIDIEKGMANGDTIVMEKEAEQVPDLARGDLIFTLKQKSHQTFRRVGDNLFLSTSLTLEEAIFGFKKTVKHLDGHKVIISPQPDQILQHNEWIIVKGEGMPKKNFPSEFGDLHVQVKIKLPTKLTENQMNLIAQVFPE